MRRAHGRETQLYSLMNILTYVESPELWAHVAREMISANIHLGTTVHSQSAPLHWHPDQLEP